MRLVAGLLSVALSALVASGAGLAASGSADELTGLWSGTDTDVREGESNSTTWEGTATIERRGDTYTLVYEITQFSQEFGHDSCSSTSVTTGEGSTTPEENGRLVFVGEAITDITSDCKFYESSGGKAQQVGERSTVGHLMEGDVIRLDLLPASHIEMQPQMEPMPEWGVIVLDDGSIDLVPPPDGVLSISRSDLPGWAADQVATVGAPVAVVGPPDVVLEGDNRVLIDGAPAARLGDPTGQGGQIVEGSDRILVNGTPAAVVGSMTVNPMITGEVPHVGGPIVHAGTYDTYRLLTEPEYRARMQAIAEAEYFIWEVETLDKFGYAYGMSVYDVLRTEEAITEQRVEHALGRALHQLQEAGHNVVRGDFDDVEIGDGVVIGGDPTDVGIVVDKGSLVLDRPLEYDHPAGTPLLVVPAELIEEARAQMADSVRAAPQVGDSSPAGADSDASPAAPVADASGDSSFGLLLVVSAAGTVALIVAAVAVRSRRRSASS